MRSVRAEVVGSGTVPAVGPGSVADLKVDTLAGGLVSGTTRRSCARARRSISISRPCGMVFLRNGSTLGLASSQLLQLDQHRQHTLKFAIEVDLIAPQPLQLIRIEGLPKRLLPHQGSVC
jgi:hypothetical protein